MIAVTEFVAALSAEFAKLRSSRGVSVALALFGFISVGVAALDGWSAHQAIVTHSPMLVSDFTPQQAGLDGVQYGQVALIALGVIVVTGEFGSGMIRLSLLAVPRRGVFLAAKMTALAVVTVVVTAPVAAVAYLTTQVALGPFGASIWSAGVPRALGGAVVYFVLMTLFSAGFAVITRNTVAPLAILIPLVLIGSHLLTLVDATKALAEYLPDRAGDQMLTVKAAGAGVSSGLTPLVGCAVLVVWVVVIQVAGYALSQVRDA